MWEFVTNLTSVDQCNEIYLGTINYCVHGINYIDLCRTMYKHQLWGFIICSKNDCSYFQDARYIPMNKI